MAFRVMYPELKDKKTLQAASECLGGPLDEMATLLQRRLEKALQIPPDSFLAIDDDNQTFIGALVVTFTGGKQSEREALLRLMARATEPADAEAHELFCIPILFQKSTQRARIAPHLPSPALTSNHFPLTSPSSPLS